MLELLNRGPALRPVRGIFAAQEIKPQARVLATDRGIECVVEFGVSDDASAKTLRPLVQTYWSATSTVSSSSPATSSS